MPARFSLLNASFDDFLFASIGEEASGMPLSVASVLARLGTDPWVEAGRLARLPQAKATEALAAMIAQVPMPSWQPSEVAGIVARLIALLPGAAAAPPPRPEPKQPTPARSESDSAGPPVAFPVELVQHGGLGALSGSRHGRRFRGAVRRDAGRRSLRGAHRRAFERGARGLQGRLPATNSNSTRRWDMAKGQKRSNREIKKPKAAKKPTVVTASLLSPPPKGKPGR